MRAHEIIEAMNGGMKSYVGVVRAVVSGAGSMNGKVRLEADSLTSARYLLYRIYGRENVYSVQAALAENVPVIKPESGENSQLKSLQDRAKQATNQLKKAKAQQQLNTAQANLSKLNQTS